METLNVDQRLALLENVAAQTKRILNFKEACVYTGYSKSTFYKMTMSRIVPFSKPNGKILRFDRDKLDAWLLSNESPGSNETEIKAATYVTSNRSRVA